MGVKLLRELSCVLKANTSQSVVDVSGVYGHCLLCPTLAGRFLETYEVTDVSTVHSQVFVDRASLIEGVVDVAAVRHHTFASTIHCLFWLTERHDDVAREYLTAIARSPESVQHRYAASCRDDCSLPPNRREEWALSFLKFRNDPADLLRECEAYWSSPYFPYSSSDHDRFWTDPPQVSSLTFCETRAFRAHRETISWFSRVVKRARCAILYGNPELWRYGV